MNTVENPELYEVVEQDNKLKSFIVEHVGNKMAPKDNNVTVEMIVEVMAEEFPEFVMVIAEENWIRGYEQGLTDVESGMSLMEEEKNEKKKSCKLCEE
tara:strand:+ start:632 stop:925 length:294 start_codon:yes stop_codon:yes gene_type:complete